VEKNKFWILGYFKMSKIVTGKISVFREDIWLLKISFNLVLKIIKTIALRDMTERCFYLPTVTAAAGRSDQSFF